MILAGFDIPDQELELRPILAGGPGGQHVNKVSSAIHLRFDVNASSLPEECKQRLLTLRDHRLTADGVIVIKAQRYRSQELNRKDALLRLEAMIDRAAQTSTPRKPTRPTVASRRRRVDDKKARGRIKKLRGGDRFPED